MIEAITIMFWLHNIAFHSEPNSYAACSLHGDDWLDASGEHDPAMDIIDCDCGTAPADRLPGDEG